MATINVYTSNSPNIAARLAIHGDFENVAYIDLDDAALVEMMNLLQKVKEACLST